MDQGSDSQHLRAQLLAENRVPVLAPKSKRTAPLDSETDLYQLREKVDRCFNNLQQFRRMAPRYEQLSPTVLAFMHLVAAWLIIK